MANTWILIRHPDKEGDKEGVYLGNTAQITPLGESQMPLVVERLRHLGPTVLTCSMLPRAVTLAEHIATELNLGKPLQTGLLNEIDKPQFLQGLSRTDPLHVEVMQAIRDGWDADTLPTHLLRGEKLRSRTDVERDLSQLFLLVEGFIPSHQSPETDVLLSVSHAKLIAAIGHKLMSRDGSLVGYYDTADRVLKIGTTGITILRRWPNRRTGKLEWQIHTWNEEVHIDVGFNEELQSLLSRIK